MLKFIFIYLLTPFYPSLVLAKSNLQVNRRLEQDLPLKEDLDKFLKPIEFLTSYVAKNTTAIEFHFALGIFVTNVHLGRVMLDKGQKIPNEYRSRIEGIFNKNENSLKDFHKNIKSGVQILLRDHVIIADLIVNSSYWIEHMKELKYELQPTYDLHDLELIYSPWDNYTAEVDNVYKWRPSPKNSDRCLVSLAVNPKSKGNLLSWCPVDETCYDILSNGTDFSYALCHRIAFLLIARLGRGCFVLSHTEDEQLRKMFCSMAYAEAQYISMNSYGIADLLFEIICLCATDGRSHFLRREWLHKLLDFQNPIGCFGKEYSLLAETTRKEAFVCSSHTTGLASGTYAAAVRLILDTYY